MTSSTSDTLLKRLRRPGDQAAWDRFVELYTPLLYYWARRMRLQEADAADLVQEVFALLLQKLPEFDYDAQRSFRGWLRKITVNKWHEKQRRLAARREASADPQPELPGPDAADEFWDREYQQHVVRRALEVMQSEFHPATWKACWEMVVGGRSAADVATEFGLSIGAARAAKFRVLRRLRVEFEGLLD
jgi:RNA polymerase sigma-70 factor (ECF subfamily)